MSHSPAASSLSDAMSSEEFPDDAKSDARSTMSLDIIQHDPEAIVARPAKRLKLTNSGAGAGTGKHHRTSTAARASSPPAAIAPADLDDSDPDLDVSSDTDGSVPASPTHPSAPANDEEGRDAADQITVCRWEGCRDGDQGNMDNLVTHLHDEHIDKSSRGQAPSAAGASASSASAAAAAKKYSCEWLDCARKGIPHASGYALRAHMRSHTREKPFYCSLPECDRAFTRSDALAKHMRTVHETEALRPSDPVPKHHSSHAKTAAGRIRLVFNKNANGGYTAQGTAPKAASDSVDADGEADDDFTEGVRYVRDATGFWEPTFPADCVFTDDESALQADSLYSLLRRQLHWAKQDAEGLQAAIAELEAERKAVFMAKELLLENVMEAESEVIERKAIPSGPDGKFVRSRVKEDVRHARELPVRGERPWWRKEDAGEGEGVGV